MLEATSENYDSLIEQNKDKIIIADFWAEWCGPCKMLGPVLQEIDNENDNIQIIKVNVDEQQDIAVKFGVQSIPTMVVYKDGQPAGHMVGAYPKQAILEAITSI